jgi:Mg-chelatase subunit ChlD
VNDDSIGEKFQVYTEDDLSFIKALQEIAQHVLTARSSREVDVVFIVDTSESMQDNIDAVRRHLSKMIDRFQTANLDFTLGVVTFHHSLVYEWLGMDITVSPQTSNAEEIREELRSIKVSGGERALDALMKAFSEVKFRQGADRHFILVTDEYVKGTYPVSEVLKAAKRAKVTIDVLGRDEPFQRTIAEQTGGIWTPIEKVNP